MRGEGLRGAAKCGWPVHIPKPRPRRGSAKAAGLAYERQMREQLGVEAVWFEFVDRLGRGWCQVDGLLVGRRAVLVLEAKLSWIEEAHQKLEGLYVPVAQQAYGKPAMGVAVARRLVPEMRLARVQVVHSLEEAVAAARTGKRVCWHWLGTAGGQVRRAA